MKFCNNSAIFEARTSRFCMVGDLDISFRYSGKTGMSGMSGMLGMLRISEETDLRTSIIHFLNYKLEVIWMMIGIPGMVKFLGM